jgi:hypothetical protein
MDVLKSYIACIKSILKYINYTLKSYIYILIYLGFILDLNGT